MSLHTDQEIWGWPAKSNVSLLGTGMISLHLSGNTSAECRFRMVTDGFHQNVILNYSRLGGHCRIPATLIYHVRGSSHASPGNVYYDLDVFTQNGGHDASATGSSLTVLLANLLDEQGLSNDDQKNKSKDKVYSSILDMAKYTTQSQLAFFQTEPCIEEIFWAACKDFNETQLGRQKTLDRTGSDSSNQSQRTTDSTDAKTKGRPFDVFKRIFRKACARRNSWISTEDQYASLWMADAAELEAHSISIATSRGSRSQDLSWINQLVFPTNWSTQQGEHPFFSQVSQFVEGELGTSNRPTPSQANKDEVSFDYTDDYNNALHVPVDFTSPSCIVSTGNSSLDPASRKRPRLDVEIESYSGSQNDGALNVRPSDEQPRPHVNKPDFEIEPYSSSPNDGALNVRPSEEQPRPRVDKPDFEIESYSGSPNDGALNVRPSEEQPRPRVDKPDLEAAWPSDHWPKRS